jgi:integrase
MLMKKSEKEKKRKRRGQVVTRGPDAHLIRVALHRDAATGRRIYHNETFHGTRAEAEKRCTQILSEVDSGDFYRPSGMTLDALLDRYISSRDVRAITLDHYTRTARVYLRGPLGPMPLVRLSALAVQDFFDGLRARGLSPGLIRNVHAVLSGALRYAVRKKLLKENHAAGVDKPKLRQKPLPAMTEAEAARFVEVARTDPNGLLFTFWLFTGLRPAELLGVRWTDIELTGEGEAGYGVLTVRQRIVWLKGGKLDIDEPKSEAGKRPVYFPAWLYADLMEHKARQDEHKRRAGDYTDKGLVFAKPTGLPMRRDVVSAGMLKPLLKRAGLPLTYSLYTLRRSFCSLLRRAGVSAKEVSEQMGHTNVNFTEKTYRTVYDSAKREMSDKLESVLSGGSCTQEAHNESGAVM